MIVAEFEVEADNSLNGKIRIGAATAKTFSGLIDKNGKFEADIEQTENFTYRLKANSTKTPVDTEAKKLPELPNHRIILS